MTIEYFRKIITRSLKDFRIFITRRVMWHGLNIVHQSTKQDGI